MFGLQLFKWTASKHMVGCINHSYPPARLATSKAIKVAFPQAPFIVDGDRWDMSLTIQGNATSWPFSESWEVALGLQRYSHYHFLQEPSALPLP